ncbi:MAG: apolipoprotein N-acyltransferase, partial [Acidimicrobiales bacterium]
RGQATGPLAPAARIGGPLGVTGDTALLAVALDAIAHRPRPWIVGAVGVAVAMPVIGRSLGHGGDAGTVRIAVVQGGGKRGLRAIHNPASNVYQAQVAATAQIHTAVDLILWPEDVIALGGPIATSPIAGEVGALAAAHHAALLAGVTEDIGKDLFRNAEVVWDDQGRMTGRYDKVHRVPFGEYIPGRSLIRHIVNLDVIPRDAIRGHGSGTVQTSAGPVGVAISFEVFFSGRSRSAVKHGGQILLIPTNTASYTTTQVTAAELAAERLRAWETGRDVVMAAPTGWSAVLDDRGRVLQRSGLGPAQVLLASVHRRTGETPYVRWGDWPWVILAAAGLLAPPLDRMVNSGKP